MSSVFAIAIVAPWVLAITGFVIAKYYRKGK